MSRAVKTAGTLSNFRVTVGSPPGTGNIWAFSVFRNGVTTVVTCSITGATATTCTSINTAVFAAGDTLSVQVIPASTPVSDDMGWVADFG